MIYRDSVCCESERDKALSKLVQYPVSSNASLIDVGAVIARINDNC